MTDSPLYVVRIPQAVGPATYLASTFAWHVCHGPAAARKFTSRADAEAAIGRHDYLIGATVEEYSCQAEREVVL